MYFPAQIRIASAPKEKQLRCSLRRYCFDPTSEQSPPNLSPLPFELLDNASDGALPRLILLGAEMLGKHGQDLALKQLVQPLVLGSSACSPDPMVTTVNELVQLAVVMNTRKQPRPYAAVIHALHAKVDNFDGVAARRGGCGGRRRFCAHGWSGDPKDLPFSRTMGLCTDSAALPSFFQSNLGEMELQKQSKSKHPERESDVLFSSC